jgi:hypothetical protein
VFPSSGEGGDTCSVGSGSSFQNVCVVQFVEYRTMGQVQKPSNSEGFACLQIAFLVQTAAGEAGGTELSSAALHFSLSPLL